MQKFKTISSERTLNLPVYRAPENNINEKSCFIDHNRIDTIKSATEAEQKAKEAEQETSE